MDRIYVLWTKRIFRGYVIKQNSRFYFMKRSKICSFQRIIKRMKGGCKIRGDEKILCRYEVYRESIGVNVRDDKEKDDRVRNVQIGRI